MQGGLFLCRQGAAFLPREENISPTRGKNIFHAWEKKEPAEEGKGLPFEERKREPSAEGDKVSSAAGESVSSAAAPEPVISAVSLSADGVPASALSFTFGEEAGAEARYAAAIGRYLYEPDAALMKAGPYRSLCQWFDVSALARNSHLYTGERCLPSFPGRCWQVLREVRLNAKEMKTLLPGGRAHVVCRNYPVGAAQMHASCICKRRRAVRGRHHLGTAQDRPAVPKSAAVISTLRDERVSLREDEIC